MVLSFVKQEESYTSKASFWDKDEIPVYNANNPKEYPFSGNRIHRGMYKTVSGKNLQCHTDVDGALNIMRKSNVVASLKALYTKGQSGHAHKNKDCLIVGGNLNIKLLKQR